MKRQREPLHAQPLEKEKTVCILRQSLLESIRSPYARVSIFRRCQVRIVSVYAKRL